MKVYVVIGGWTYEGYGYPLAVFTTAELAEEAKTALQRKRPLRFDFVDVHDFELDEFKQ